MFFMNYFDFFIKKNKSGYKTREKYLKLNYPEIYNSIINYCSDDNLNKLSFKQKIWHFINETKTIPKCYCGIELTFKKSLSEGYGKYCSIICTNKDEDHIDDVKRTNNIKYGGETPFSNKDVRLKSRETMLKTYGVDNIFKDINHIREKTIEKHGVNHISQLEKTKRKKEETNLKVYGVKTPLLINEVRYKSNVVKEKKFFEKYQDLDLIKVNGGEITIKCNVCNKEYIINRSVLWHRNLITENPCTICNPIKSGSSIVESEIKDFINSLGIKYIEHDRTILDGKELDIYIESLKIGIEYDGLFWHSNKFIDKNYHLNKTELCSIKGVKLIHIFEDEWLLKKDIVKSRLKALFGLTKHKIYGRKCEIKHVSTPEKTDFLKLNHIQSETGSKVNIGLYYDNTLVSLMTFGSKRIALGQKNINNTNEWELIRFCNKLDTIVIGGASKLLQYFIKTYHPKEIISYADRRWSQGNMYKKLGFLFHKTSQPNYYYIINNKRENRFKYRKDILISEGFDKNKSEHEIMLERGIYKIYDCGTICFKMKININYFNQT